jgi:hypothetical protein
MKPWTIRFPASETADPRKILAVIDQVVLVAAEGYAIWQEVKEAVLAEANERLRLYDRELEHVTFGGHKLIRGPLELVHEGGRFLASGALQRDLDGYERQLFWQSLERQSARAVWLSSDRVRVPYTLPPVVAREALQKAASEVEEGLQDLQSEIEASRKRQETFRNAYVEAFKNI